MEKKINLKNVYEKKKSKILFQKKTGKKGRNAKKKMLQKRQAGVFDPNA